MDLAHEDDHAGSMADKSAVQDIKVQVLSPQPQSKAPAPTSSVIDLLSDSDSDAEQQRSGASHASLQCVPAAPTPACGRGSARA
eukprot:CAMPEP_0202874602 /NCGR_PEP_ID=MMETSP1391-20130828/25699_1 /ASSEMBLY_ACC=CAM_ASM_000867 /TAXON_ID=1034604 /ORGANISM="Chlamydomonas leiostraca, Strain SAG 11-49" /LENGTH=83 /DNA_ID=CAMNT_0049556069 /DNA_START=68 /DNA_END=316 /DNA_ORIENTATION=+